MTEANKPEAKPVPWREDMNRDFDVLRQQITFSEGILDAIQKYMAFKKSLTMTSCSGGVFAHIETDLSIQPELLELSKKLSAYIQVQKAAVQLYDIAPDLGPIAMGNFLLEMGQVLYQKPGMNIQEKNPVIQELLRSIREGNSQAVPAKVLETPSFVLEEPKWKEQFM